MIDLILKIAGIVSAVAVIGGAAAAAVSWISKLVNGQRCLLRNELLKIYYRYESTCQIREYDRQNADQMYSEYKALHGNTFVDTIYLDNICKWKIIP